MDDVLFEQEGAVGRLILNRPEKRNALSLAVMNAVTERLAQIAADRSVQVLVLSGNGPAFCAGHDLKELTGDHDVHHYRRIFAVCSDMMAKIHQLPQPVIAQVHGIATAAGCQLVAACDLAVAEEGARFATPGITIGLFCTTPMVPLVRAVGRRRALEMLFSGRFVSAREAEHFGLVNRVVAPDRLADETTEWARQLAQFSPFTMATGKRAFYAQVDLDEAAAYRYAQEIMISNCLAEDAQEGMSAFLEKRSPVWKGR
ncbi:MAG: enoyl-CoA hydratase [Syntrophobacteraceae bacterium CG2_30_61_12]|nr:MAG: enoyl-CoA hydratase [Syntrophobacteraceae bacterium CG2_30_61_12]